VTVNVYRPSGVDTAMQAWIRSQDPQRVGDPADAFEVIVPSLPGFGYSTPTLCGLINGSRLDGLVGWDHR
jgi:hypothetical protein